MNRNATITIDGSRSTYEPELDKLISGLEHIGNCADQLMFTLYHLEADKFIYCTPLFKKMLGFKFNRFDKEGWIFWWENIGSGEALNIKSRIHSCFALPVIEKPLTFCYHFFNGQDQKRQLKHEMVLYRIEDEVLSANYFMDVTDKEAVDRYLCERSLAIHARNHRGVNLITPREEEVLKLIADGYSSKQIAHRLFISNHTAITHRRHLIGKFRVKNTAQLIKKASQLMEL